MIELPPTIDVVNYREWATFEPYYTELIEREISADTQREWLQDWSDLTRFWQEVQAYTSVQRTLDTADAAREAAYLDVVKEVLPHVEKAEQKLKQRLLQLHIFISIRIIKFIQLLLMAVVNMEETYAGKIVFLFVLKQ